MTDPVTQFCGRVMECVDSYATTGLIRAAIRQEVITRITSEFKGNELITPEMIAAAVEFYLDRKGII